MDSLSYAFQTLCAYARLYIEEYGDKAEVDELERIITSLSQGSAIPDTAAGTDKASSIAPTAATTVAKLIQLLRPHPQDMRVVVDGYEGGYTDVKPQGIITIPVSLNVNDEWYRGNHDNPSKGMPVVTALLISSRRF